MRIGVCAYNLRGPKVVAQQTISLNEISGDRFLFRVGAGWLRQEFAALGVTFDRRVERLEESLEMLRRGWSGAVAGPDELILWAHELCPPGPDRWAQLPVWGQRLGLEGSR